MAGYYKVELAALTQLTKELSSCAADMRSAMRILKDIGPEGSGYGDLEDACNDFQNAWSYGIGKIADATGGITDGLSQTCKAYELMEDQVSASFQAPGKAGGK
jgi:hypothetical protein